MKVYNANMKCPNCHHEITSSLASKCPNCGYKLTPEVYQQMHAENDSELDPNLSSVNPNDIPSIWRAVLIVFMPFVGISLMRRVSKKTHQFTWKVYNICTIVGFIMYIFIILMIVGILLP